MLYTMLILYNGAVVFLPLILWSSRKNLSTILGIPAFLIAYVFGGMHFIEYAVMVHGISQDTQDFYSYLLLISFVITTFFLAYGFYKKNILQILVYQTVRVLNFNEKKMLGYGRIVGIMVLLLFSISFLGMGFIPMFAENTMAAKFMVGEYQDLYANFAIPYRLALNFSQIALLLLFTRQIKKKSVVDIIIIVALMVCLAFSLRRGMVLTAFLNFILSYFIYKHRKMFWPAVFVYFLIYCVGSAFNRLFFYFIGLQDNIDFTAVLAGMPDVADQLWFLDNWLKKDCDYTWGLSIIGGLVPYHFDYNISVLSQTVIGATVGEASSGGFRLPIALLGYVAFGWIGVVIFSVLQGFLSGTILQVSKKVLGKAESLEQFIIYNSFIFQIIGTVLGFLSGLGIDSVANCFMIFILLWLSRTKFRWST